MYKLAIETTTVACSIAIEKDNRIIYQDFAEQTISHSQTLMLRIDNALKYLNLDKKDLKAVCVSNGPGSFTGIRIGLATAKGICKGLQIPLIALNTLEILATNAFGTDKNIITLLDARMNQMYISIYDPNLNLLLPNQCIDYEADLMSLVDEKVGKDRKFICLGFTKFVNENDRFQLALPHQNLLLATSQFSLLKHKKIELKYDKVYISNIEPFYVRNVV